ncbi:hypothetical protein QUB32_29295 [Microcoleus sp. AT8-A4]
MSYLGRAGSRAIADILTEGGAIASRKPRHLLSYQQVARRSQLTERYAPARHRFSCLKSQLWDIHLNS